MDVSLTIIFLGAIVLAVGALIGWLLGGRGAETLKAERDSALNSSEMHLASFRTATTHLDVAEREREALAVSLAALEATRDADAKAHDEKIAALTSASEALSAQFKVVGQQILDDAQKCFLERADQRFGQAAETNSEKLKLILQPVEATLQRYEDNLTRVEKEREGSYRELTQAVSQLAVGNAGVVKETQRLANVMRSSPKHRGRWGEEQLKNILETAGLSQNVDFTVQTSVSDGDKLLRPDCIVNLPGDRCIVIDVKCPLVAFEEAFEEEDEQRRSELLLQHANALKSYANDLGRKGYWKQFDRSPEFVVMYVPGEHFLAAAAERAPDLIENAFRNGVVIASTINLLALAKIMAGMWRQEALREQAQEIGDAGKELYRRLSKMGENLVAVGRNIKQSANAYDALVGSIETSVLPQARRFESISLESSSKRFDIGTTLDVEVRPLKKLASGEEAAE